MSIKKDKYEISLWEDYVVPAQGEGENLIPEHYEERKIAVIGSNTMSAQWRAVEPKLVNNINGTNTLTFKMFYSFINNETGEKEDNPMLGLMVNERKIKCLWKNKWYDLVIKSCQEDSNGKSITYTCKDLFINELSKTGFDIVFDIEKENNHGTVTELASEVLKGTDWQLGVSDVIKQYKEEPVYEVSVVSSFSTNEETTINVGDKILVFYSVFVDRNKFFQFWYDKKQLYLTDKSSMLVNEGSCESIEVEWKELTYNGIPSWGVSYNNTIICYISKEAIVSDRYHAKKLVRTQSQTIDPLIEKRVYKYTKKDSGKEVYGYYETSQDSVNIIQNYIVNNTEFKNTDSWIGPNIDTLLYPLFTANITDNYKSQGYLYIPQSSMVRNVNFKDQEGFIRGEKYIFRTKAMTESNSIPSGIYCTNTNLYLRPWIGKFKRNLETDVYTKIGNNYFDVSAPVINGNWVEFTLTCNTTISVETSDEIGFFIDNSNTATANRWIENVEFFKYVIGEPIVQDYNSEVFFTEDNVVLYNKNYYICLKENTGISPTNSSYWKNLGTEKPEVRINPFSYTTQSVANITWKFYEAGQSVLKADNLEYLFSGDDITAKNFIENNLNIIYNENYEKVRDITAKQSNRFNLLQKIAEAFECWIVFQIEHDENGKIIYERGVPKKWVSFKNNIGIETGVGFIYGIDLKTISRTINSDSITSKVIVLPNSNQFGKNGFCGISRAEENYSKADFILNFDYYISQGLLSQSQINKDLYSPVEQIGFGYYYWLKKYNTQLETIEEKLKGKETELVYQKDQVKKTEKTIDELSEQKVQKEAILTSKTGYSTFSISKVQKYLSKNPNDETAKNAWIVRNNLIASLHRYNNQLLNLNTSVNNLNEYLYGDDGVATQYELLVQKIEELDAKFYKKYSRFIQEGSWISEDYYDDNLYYLDAVSTAYTSSRPQIQYNISVLRLSALEEFKNKIFNLGDISFIQDVEFFGYTNINGVKTPYKEKVLVSEITSNFDSPEKDNFKVQNYKTQFEDLFQRITATTQSLQYSTGAYNNAANSFTQTGEIEGETLAKSFQLNQNLAWAATDDSVTYDTTGMTVVDTTDPTKIVRISSKGIQITEDGGKNWYLGITGSGISTQYLTSGFITTDKINIMDGDYSTFRWDKYGINAFYYDLTDGVISNVNDGNFVRFDRFGLYGIDTELSSAWMPETEEEIWETGKFGLTWKGFFMKNKYGDGYVAISSEEDFVVNDGNKNINEGKGVNRIKIGKIGEEIIVSESGETITQPIFGLFIADATGARVMETNDDGTLWLKNRLNIETKEGYTVGIGKLGASTENGKNEIINANNKFLVYEDGSIKATDGTFTGTVYATAGKIGNLSVEDVENVVSQSKGIEIESINGFTFTINSTTVVVPDKISLSAKLIGIPNETIYWSGSMDGADWIDYGTGEKFDLTYNEDLFESGIYYIKVTCADYSDIVSITKVKDGISPVIIVIESSAGDVYINNDIETILTAKVYQENIEITTYYNDEDFIWSKVDLLTGEPDVNWRYHNHQGKYIAINGSDVDKRAVINCELKI